MITALTLIILLVGPLEALAAPGPAPAGIATNIIDDYIQTRMALRYNRDLKMTCTQKLMPIFAI